MARTLPASDCPRRIPLSETPTLKRAYKISKYLAEQSFMDKLILKDPFEKVDLSRAADTLTRRDRRSQWILRDGRPRGPHERGFELPWGHPRLEGHIDALR